MVDADLLEVTETPPDTNVDHDAHPDADADAESTTEESPEWRRNRKSKT